MPTPREKSEPADTVVISRFILHDTLSTYPLLPLKGGGRGLGGNINLFIAFALTFIRVEIHLTRPTGKVENRPIYPFKAQRAMLQSRRDKYDAAFGDGVFFITQP